MKFKFGTPTKSCLLPSGTPGWKGTVECAYTTLHSNFKLHLSEQFLICPNFSTLLKKYGIEGIFSAVRRTR